MKSHPLLLLFLALLAACRTAPTLPIPRDVGYERWKYFYEERAYPHETVPASARRAAFAQLPMQERERVEGDAAAPRWQSLGPQPVDTAFAWKTATGRINALAVSPADPNLILAGASSGGVWRSTDGGATFVPVSDAHVDLSIGAIVFAPSDPRIVYAAMGSDFLGTGVLRSDDAGLTWRAVSGSSFSQRGRSWRAVVDPANPNRLWVAQTERQGLGSSELEIGLLLSEDGGVTWKNVLPARLTDLVMVPGTTTLFAAISSSRWSYRPGVQKSVDGGKTWQSVYELGSVIPMAPYAMLAVSKAKPDRIYVYAIGARAGAATRHVAVSDDGGATWTTKDIALPAEIPFYLAADPADANALYIGFRDGYKSSDGGATWTNVTKSLDAEGRFVPRQSTTHIDQHSIAFAPNALYLGNDGGIYKSLDGARTFTSLAATLSVVQAYAIAGHPTDPATLWLGTQDNGLERRNPNGTWRELITGDYGSIAFDPNDPSRVISNYIEGSLMRVLPNGHWSYAAENKTFGESEDYPRIAFIAPFEQLRATNTLYFGTYRLFASTDFGATWKPTADTDLTAGGRDHLRAIGISEQHPHVIYTGSRNGRVMLSKDAGATWANVTAGLPQRTVKAFAIDPRNAATAYVAFSGYGSDHVFVTRNSGANWTALANGLPDVPVNALLIDPVDADALIAGTDIGVFRYEAGAWRLWNGGMPNVVVSDFAITADRRIVAATYGRGAYELVRTAPYTRRRAVR